MDSGATDSRAGTAVVLRPLGSPTALGFFALASATLVVSGNELGWLGATERRSVGVILLAVPFVLQLVAAILAFLARDAAVGGALGVQATTWGAIGVVFVVSPAPQTTDALGLLLVASAVHSLVGGLAIGISRLLPGAVVVATGTRFALAGVYELSGAEAWQDAAGAVGLVVGALAVYAAAAVELEETQGRAVLPLGRRGEGQRALAGALPDQVAGLEHEAGVRKRL